MVTPKFLALVFPVRIGAAQQRPFGGIGRRAKLKLLYRNGVPVRFRKGPRKAAGRVPGTKKTKKMKTMKTQISNLINGSKNVIRNMEDAKYMTAKPATSHNGHAGTNRDERNEIAAKVYEENGDTLNITAKGIALTLTIHRSTTGKSWSWGCPLTEEQYVALGGRYTDGTLKAYRIEVTMSCEVILYSFTRKSDAAQWRVSNTTYLDESFVQII